MTRQFPLQPATLIVAGLVGTALSASDHRDAPYTPRDPMADIGDSFLFQGAQSSGLTVAFTINPLSGSGAPGTLGSYEIRLDPALIYVFKLDTDHDAVADLTNTVRVNDIDGQVQRQTVGIRRATGTLAQANIWSGDAVGTDFTTTLNPALEVTTGTNEELLFIGPRRDPFHFNITSVQEPAALAIKQALPGGDHLPAAPTSLRAFGISDKTLRVLEIPELSQTALNYGVVVAEQTGNAVDRMGRVRVQGIFFVDPPVGFNPDHYGPVDPKYSTVGVFNDAYNAATPSEGLSLFGGLFKFSFERLEVAADKLTDKVDFDAPDMIGWDPAQPAGYPNGRGFVADAIFWTVKGVNPFFCADPDGFLPRSSDQDLNMAKFPYAAPSINQAWKPGVPVHPVAPI